MVLAMRVRVVLREYSESQLLPNDRITLFVVLKRDVDELVLQQAGVSSLPRPEKFDLKDLRDWLEDPKGGNFPLIGADRDWTQSTDLLALRRRNESDPFSRWVMEKLIPRYHRVLGHTYKYPSINSNEISYSDSIVLYVASVLAATLASLLVVGSVIILYEVAAMRAQLGAMAAFTVVFSLSLTLLTNTKRSDVFAATAA